MGVGCGFELVMMSEVLWKLLEKWSVIVLLEAIRRFRFLGVFTAAIVAAFVCNIKECNGTATSI